MELRHEIICSPIKICDNKETSTEEKVCDWHFHDEFEIFFLVEGNKFFYTKDKTVEMGKGDIVFVNRRVPHKTFTTVGSSGILIQFNDDFMVDEFSLDKYIISVLKNQEVDIVSFPALTFLNKQLCVNIRKIRKEFQQKQDFYNLYIKSYIFQILACLYRFEILVAPNKLIDKKAILEISPVLNYVNEHYMEPISLNEMSKVLYKEKSYFCKLFKRATNTTFLNYLNLIRICHAETLLRETGKTIAEISNEVGFSSASYFSEIFRKVNLLSPTEYRKMFGCANLM